MFNTNWKQDWDTKVKLEDELNTKLSNVQGGKYLNDLLNQYKEFKEYSGDNDFRTFIDVCYPDNVIGYVGDYKVFCVDDIIGCSVDFKTDKNCVLIKFDTQNKCIGKYKYNTVAGCVKMLT